MGQLEPLTGGLNNADHPAMLEQGELTLANDAYYKNTSDLLFHAPVFTYVSDIGPTGTFITDMVSATYDNGNNYLVALGTYTSGPIGDPTVPKLYRGTMNLNTPSVTWTDVTSSCSWFTSSGTSLNTLQYGDQYYLLAGGGTANTVMKNDGSFRAHGLTPVASPPTLNVVTGVWPLTNTANGSTVPAWYDYWVTEIVKDGSGNVIVESDTDPKATASVYIPNATSGVSINYLDGTSRAWSNATATHWRVYRSVKKSYNTDTAFPNGILISVDIPRGTTYFTDGNPVTSNFFQPGALDTSSSANNTGWNGGGAFSNTAGNVINGVAGTAKYKYYDGTEAKLTLKNFGFTGLVEPPTGITCRITFTVNSVTKLNSTDPDPMYLPLPTPTNNQFIQMKYFDAQISVDGGNTWTSSLPKQVSVKPNATGTWVATLGGDNDLWGIGNPTAASIADNNLFRFRLVLKPVNVYIGTNAGFYSMVVEINIDTIELKVTCAVGVPSSSTPFSATYVSLGGVSAASGENGKPPVASCGCILADSMILNDVSKPQRVLWSVPGKMDAFPSQYYIDIETPENDVVTAIASYGGRGIVMLNNSIWRLNYVPTEDDVRFQRGPALDLIDPNFGCVGPNAWCEFVDKQGRPEIAYLSSKGLRSTDGFTTRVLCDNFDWTTYLYPDSAPANALSNAVLLNNPDNEEIILFAPGLGNGLGLGVPANLVLHLPYSSRHTREDGKLKVTGPVTSSSGASGGFASSAVNAMALFKTYSAKPKLSTIVFGAAIEAVTTPGSSAGYRYPKSKLMWYSPYELGTSYYTHQFSWQTRVIYANGFDTEFRIKEVYVGPTLQDNGTLTLSSYNRTGVTTADQARTITGSSIFFPKTIFDRRAQGIQFKFVSTGSGVTPLGGVGAIDYLGEDFKKEDR